MNLKTVRHRNTVLEDAVGAGLIRLFCAITQQAIQDAHDCNGYGAGVDAILYLNSETVQDWHDVIGVNIRRKWTFAEAKKVRVDRWV